MCGRANLVATGSEIEELFGLDEPLPALAPRYNMAPSQQLLVVRAGPGARRGASLLMWGLVRGGSRGEERGSAAKAPINLKVESAQKGALSSLVRARRCVVPLSGFYEWRRTGRLSQPYNIRRRDHQPFGVAGIWGSVEREQLPALETCLVLTMPANRVVEPIHARMPLMLAPGSYDAWLDPQPREPQDLLQQIQHLDPDALEAYTVSPRVNSAAHEDAACLEPVNAASLW